MNIRTIGLLIKCILALGFLGFGIWIILLFDPENTKEILLKTYQLPIGIGSFFLGILVAVGRANLSRILIGFMVLALGLGVLLYCQAFRTNLMGQVITNLFAPALCLGGIWVMLDFKGEQ